MRKLIDIAFLLVILGVAWFSVRSGMHPPLPWSDPLEEPQITGQELGY